MTFLAVDDSATIRRIVVNSLHRIEFKETVEAGVSNSIVKPFTPKVLKEKINSILPAVA